MTVPRPARLRTELAGALLRRVAGPDPAAARDAIHRTPGPRWFAADSAIARVHGDASMFVGGIRALLLQALHPRAMAAVAAHSGYRSDPWGRLQRTATFLAATTFGPVEQAEQYVAVVRAVHARISGVTPDGEPYRASDPHLLTWVHVAEVDSFLLAHQRFGRTPLDEAGCDEYVAQAARVARALGGHDVPTTLAGLRSSLGAYRPELRGTAAARETADFLLREPPLPRTARLGYSALAAAAVSLMPAWTRAELDLPWSPTTQSLGGIGGTLATKGIRWALDAAEPGSPPEDDESSHGDEPHARDDRTADDRAADDRTADDRTADDRAADDDTPVPAPAAAPEAR
ncbi:oxygenase MpaB family protein [Actinotalea sp.]|uniref:oxygenase MpaB family protein n=1 Tax=Actinotalea sp. TaxID=1872145 RepID=UPI00356993D0